MALGNDAGAILVGAERLRSTIDKAVTLGAKSPASKAYQIKSRVKSLASITKKIEDKRPNRPEYDIKDVKDIVGFRFLTLFQQDLISLVEVFADFVVRFQNQPVDLFYGEKLTDCVEEVIVYQSGTNQKIYGTIFRFLRSFFIARGFGEEFVKLDTKDTNYSSVHILLLGQIHEHAETVVIPIEFQLRTVFEDVWSEVEHKLIYKNSALSNSADDERRREVGAMQLKNLKNFIDACSQGADDAFFFLKSEGGNESIRTSSATAPSNLATIFIGLKDVLPEAAHRDIDQAFQVLEKAYRRLIDLKGDYKGQKLVAEFGRVLDELDRLDRQWRQSAATEDQFEQYLYCIEMERAAAKVWMGQILRAEQEELGQPGTKDKSEKARTYFEEARQIYFDIASHARFANEPVLNFRIGGIYRLMGQIDVAIEYFEVAVAGMTDGWRHSGTVFEVLIPRHLGYLLWKQADDWRQSNPRLAKRDGAQVLGHGVADRFAALILRNLRRAFEISASLDHKTIEYGELVSRDPQKEKAAAYNNALWYAIEYIKLGGAPEDLTFDSNGVTRNFDKSFYEPLYAYYPIDDRAKWEPSIIDTFLRASQHFDDRERGLLWFDELNKRRADTARWLTFEQSSRASIEEAIESARLWLDASSSEDSNRQD